MNPNSLHFKKLRALIVGDVMLDQYWHGVTTRISPEAPIPIVKIEYQEERAGGAANVAQGMAQLGARVTLCGLVGSDQSAKSLESILQEQGISCLFQACAQPTITKLRILSRQQQIVRVDQEEHFHNLEALQSLLNDYVKKLPQTDMVILSDYNKGTLQHCVHMIEKANQLGIPVIVDPKSNDYSQYQGASVITPNLKEFEAVVGKCASIEEMVLKARALLEKNRIHSMILTRAEQGLSVISQEMAYHIPASAKQVHDVTGAGDTVVAVLAMAMGSGFEQIQAGVLANIAAGIVVGKLGTATVSLQEIEQQMSATQFPKTGILTEEGLLKVIQEARSKGEKIVFTNGCFDILHAGHVMYLQEAKALGDRLIVAINTDESVQRLKGTKRPINQLLHRMEVLSALDMVDWVVAFSEDTPERLIQQVVPDVLVKGGDYTDIKEIVGSQFVIEQGGTVKILGIKEGLSTSLLIDKILT